LRERDRQTETDRQTDRDRQTNRRRDSAYLGAALRVHIMGGDLGGTEWDRPPKIWGGGRPMHPSPQYFEK